MLRRKCEQQSGELGRSSCPLALPVAGQLSKLNQLFTCTTARTCHSYRFPSRGFSTFRYLPSRHSPITLQAFSSHLAKLLHLRSSSSRPFLITVKNVCFNIVPKQGGTTHERFETSRQSHIILHTCHARMCCHIIHWSRHFDKLLGRTP